MSDGLDQIYQGPEGTALRFFTQPVKNNFQSEAHGRPIYDTALMVEVMVPAMRESTPQFEVERTYCEEVGLDENGQRKVVRTEKYDMYRPQIEAFKAQSNDGAIQGTPLSQWPQVDAGTVATLRAAGVFTVEQLSEVADGNLSKLGIGGRVLREQAKAYLQTRTFGIPSAQMSAEITHLREENERLTNENADLKAKLSAVPSDTTIAVPPAAPVENMFTPPAAPTETVPGLTNMFTPPDTPPATPNVV